MKLQTRHCGCEITTSNAQYLGAAMGLDFWNCPKCGTTITVAVQTEEEIAA